MSLAINARFLTQPVSGVQRYAREVLGALDALLVEDPELAQRLGPVTAYTPHRPVADPDWSQIKLEVLEGARSHLWEQTTLLRATRQTRLLSLGNSGPLLHPHQIVAFHDTHLWDMPDAYDWRYRLWHKTLRGPLARRAAKTVTVSAHSANALAARLRLPEARFRIVPNAADHILRQVDDPSICARYDLAPRRYLLSVGNASENKNIPRLLEAHARIPDALPLVIVGGDAPGLAKVGLTPQGAGARLIGRVADSELANLMRYAGGFVFPSLHEGFGIPPLEAMALGVPVAAARSGALPDVLGTAPLWFEPRNTDDIARALSDLGTLSSSRRIAMIQDGLRQSSRYRWRSSAQDLVHVLKGSDAA
ncbi:glycosyltransferase family 1 protein [Roseivivax sp. THAF197b]|uniref:glycosyltransferase family 4 protein n=1 Tax=Roseivivax sp. THAF197b TaxID=2588299 RepID=UPI00126846DD|nr:glycosyltransferase family 1 protein [Roseivivax sp. THAF197b]QFS84998.1 GDP-mannose-dependent alpha-(1-6)-phosphatidylinositol monomannoside mannosyltransferase [Roseivivax sp. THAF197b]